MLILKINQEKGEVRIGEVTVHFIRVGERTIEIGIDAPREQRIVTSWDRRRDKDIDATAQNVVGKP